MLKAAFKKAIQGRRCTICSRYVSHAYYLRHRDECKVADDDDDLVVVAELINHYGPKNDALEKLETTEIQTQYPTTLCEDDCQMAEGYNDILEEFFDSYGHRNDALETVEVEEIQTQFPTTSAAAEAVCRCEFELVAEDAYTECVLMDKPMDRSSFSVTVGKSRMQKIAKDTDENNSRLSYFSVKEEIDVVELIDSSGDGEPPAKRLSSLAGSAYGLDPSSAYDCLITRLNFLHSEYRYNGSASQSQPTQSSSEDFYSQRPLSEDLHHLTEVVTQQHEYDEMESLSNVEADPLSAEDYVQIAITSNRSQIGVHHSVEFFWQIALKVLRRTNSGLNVREDAVAFWGAENITNLVTLFSCSVEAQQVFMKLLMFRRRWLPLSKIRVSNMADVEPFMKELVLFNLVDEGGAECKELSLQDCLIYLTVPDLMKLSKKFKLKCNNTNRKELVDQLRNMGTQRNVFNNSIGSIMKKSVFEVTGNFYLLSEHMYYLCHTMLTLYSPTAMDTSALVDDPRTNLVQQLFYNMLQLKTKQLVLPGPPSDSITLISVFHTYDDLLSYVKSKCVEESILCSSQTKSVEELVEAIQELKNRLMAHLGDGERFSFYRRLQPYMRKFTTPRVLIRCIHHYTEILQRLRAYEEANQLLEYLLESFEVRLFCTGHQLSVWYDRRSLVLDAHLKRRELALAVCVTGLRESEMPDVGALALQARAQRLIGADLSLAANYRVPFVQCAEPKYLTIEGFVLGKNLGDQRVNHFYLPAQSTDDADFIRPCTVEMVALHHFLNNRGFNEGMHAEGSIWHTVFGLICYDVIFDHQIKDVWFSELQTHPCDLNSKEFYVNRMRQFDAVFDELVSPHSEETIYGRVLRSYTKFKHSTNSELNLTLFRDVRHIMDFLACCTPSLLVAVFRRLVENYRKNRSGFPDLTVWNTESRTLAVVEVKGPNDRLSNKQRLWLDFFVGEGVDAYVCNVKAKKCRALH